MTYDHLDLEQSAGAQQIQAYCYDVSQALGLELRAVWWRWLYTAPAGSPRHGLSIEATVGSSDCRLTCADIEGYATGQTTDAVNATIRTKLDGFCRKVRFLGQNPKIWCQELESAKTWGS